MEYNKPLLKEEAGFEYDYYALPKLADSEVHNTVEVKVQASFSSSAGYSGWVSARPELLLLKVCTVQPHATALGTLLSIFSHFPVHKASHTAVAAFCTLCVFLHVVASPCVSEAFNPFVISHKHIEQS